MSMGRQNKILLIVSIVMVIIIAIVTILMFSNFTKKAPVASKSLSATKLVDSYKTAMAAQSLVKDQYTTRSTDDTIKYQLSGKKYTIEVKADKSLLFQAKAFSATDDTAFFQSETTKFMQQQQLTKATSSNTSYSKSQLFTSDNAVCELTDIFPPSAAKSPQRHQMSCIDLTKIKNEYSSIAKLLALNPNSSSYKNITNISKTGDSKSNVTYATLTISHDETTDRVLFAAVDNNWSYLGKFDSSSIGQYSLSDELKIAINDPKYKGFLTENFSSSAK